MCVYGCVYIWYSLFPCELLWVDSPFYGFLSSFDKRTVASPFFFDAEEHPVMEVHYGHCFIFSASVYDV